jgi:hypothetical protein
MSAEIRQKWDASVVDLADAGRLGTGRGRDWVVWGPWLTLLLVVIGLLLWFPLVRAAATPAIAYNEGWNLYWQEAAASGSGLYRAAPEFTIENYPPLSFHLIGLLGVAIGDTNLAGRTVSLVSLGLVCLLTGMIAARFTGSRASGWYAGLCPLIWVGILAPDRVAMNDPQWLGMVPELLGFTLYARWPSSIPALCGSALLFALAVFTKDNLIAVPIAVGVNLAVSRDWKGFCVWAGTGLVVAGALLAATVGIDGGFFLDHLLRARAMDLRAGGAKTLLYCGFFAPILVIIAIWGWRQAHSTEGRLLALGWAVAHGVGVALGFGHGVAINIMFEAMMFDAIAMPVAFQAFLNKAGGRSRFSRVGLLVICAAWPVVLMPGLLTDGLHAWKALPRTETDFAGGADFLRARAGVTWCEDLLMCHAAGKPMVFDAYFTQDQIETGRLAACALLRPLVSQVPASVEIGAPQSRRPVSTQARLRFNAGFMRTLMTYYAPVLRTDDFTILAPLYGPWRGGGDTCRGGRGGAGGLRAFESLH